MSSRKTRRGTLLEGDSKTERIKQNCTSKGDQLSSEHLMSPQQYRHLANDPKVCNSSIPNEDFQNSKSSFFNSSPEDLSLTKRNLWDCLQKGVKKKEDLSSSNVASNDSTSKKVLKETVSFSNASVVQDTPKKSRKPEILVSLLENEAYPCVKLKSKSDEKPRVGDDNNKMVLNQRSRCSGQVNKFRDGDTFPTPTQKHVCFFPYREHHNKENEFLPISEVPEEPFLVSLSKDKNKELNMVTTSCGTLRVGPGCSMRRFLPSGSSGKLPSGEFNCGDTTELELRRETKDNKKLNSLLPDLIRGTLPSTSNSQTLQLVGNQRESKEEDISSCASSIDTSLSEADKSLSVQDFEKISEEITESKDNVSAQGPEVNSSNEVAQEQESGYFSDLTSFEDCIPPTFHKASMFPLFEDPSISENIQVITTSVGSSQEGIDGNETSKKESEEPGSLLRSSTEYSKVTSFSTLYKGSGRNKDSKSAIKRSERIRCKSKLPMEAKVKLEKYIPTPSVKASKPKLKCVERLIPKIKPALTNKGLKKVTTINSKNKKGLTVKIAKPLKKKKCQMTRKIMDGIVQSIEETVLRASQEEYFEDVEKSREVDTAKTLENISNQEPSLPTGLSSFKDLSSSELPAMAEKELGSQLSKNNLDHVVKKKVPKLHKKKERASKSKIHSHPSAMNKKLAKTSKHKQLKKLIQTKSNFDESNGTKSDNIVQKMKAPLSESLSDPETSKNPATVSSKRSRTKSKKAKEAFDDIGLDVFWEDEEPTKRSKSKKRVSTPDNESCSGSTKRPRRNSQLGELMSDPVLEKHAFILWASENRSQVETQHPSASTYEVDAILSSRWCDVLNSMKARFFLRAREALSDDDRLSLQARSRKGKTVAIFVSVRVAAEVDVEVSIGDDNDDDDYYDDFATHVNDDEREFLMMWMQRKHLFIW
ncbi:hypothetical protein ElyMa_002714700 [Elysia marginata]|uniref:HMG box domain-containing protein n=1 Tax=Elysia marginata TaxID=1093978 RepID=A0AAV4HGL9_9GAST|nr:hypothetical protein ElyMa_002714700 [Elysia marginata]